LDREDAPLGDRRPNAVATPFQARNHPGEVDPPPAESQSPYLINPLTVLLPEPELNNIAVSLALAGHGLEAALAHLSTVHNSKTVSLEMQYTAQKAGFDNGLKRANDEIEIEKQTIEAAQSQIGALQGEKLEVMKKAQDLRVQINKRILEIRKARLEKEQQFFKEEDEHLRQETARSHQERLFDMENQLDRAKKLHELKQQKWELNAREYERRRAVLQVEQDEVEERLKRASERVEKLADLGITRTTGGFLVWAGYVSFAGVSGVIANLLAQRETASTDYVSLFIKGITHLIGADANQPLWMVSGNMLILLLISLLAVYATLWLADKWLGRFDSAWLSGSEKKKKGKQKQRSRQDIQSQFSFNIPEISRKSYTQLLAAFPYLIIAAIVLFVLAAAQGAAGSAPGSAPSSVPKANAGTTYIGFVITLLSTAVMLLYANYIIEPRWYKHATPKESYAYFAKVRAHWEFATLVVLLIVSLGYAAFAYIAPPGTGADAATNTRIWGLLAIFMALSSMALAYGLIQRGLFKDVDHLENDLRLYRRLIEYYSTLPTVEDEFEYTEPNELNEILADYRKTRHRLDELRLMYGLKRTFADQLMKLHDFEVLRYWVDSKKGLQPKGMGKAMKLPRLLKMLMKRPWKFIKSSEPDVLDYEVAPEETIEVYSYGQEKQQNEERKKQIEEESTKQQAIIAAAKAKLVELLSLRDKTEAENVALTKEYEYKNVYLILQQKRELIKFIEAFNVGALLAQRLGYNPPEPPNDAGGLPAGTAPPSGPAMGGAIGAEL
jgi:acetoin utilization deacetylase AcuC-like enzyme